MDAAKLGFVFICLVTASTIDWHVEQSQNEERMERQAEIQQALKERRAYESRFLLHPLSCEGTWIKKCSDFEPCEKICIEKAE